MIRQLGCAPLIFIHNINLREQNLLVSPHAAVAVAPNVCYLLVRSSASRCLVLLKMLPNIDQLRSGAQLVTCAERFWPATAELRGACCALSALCRGLAAADADADDDAEVPMLLCPLLLQNPCPHPCCCCCCCCCYCYCYCCEPPPADDPSPPYEPMLSACAAISRITSL